METDHLRTALELVRHGTVNRTAAELGLAPSTVSARLRRLEDEVGTRLFVRDRDGMRPTAAGRAYLAEVEPALARLDAAGERLRAPHLRLGAQATIADALLPVVLDRMAARDGGTQVSVRPEADRRRLLRAVADGETDAALLLDTGDRLGDLGFEAPARLEYLDVREVPLVAVAGPGHPLVGRRLDPAAIREGASLLGHESRCSFWMATQRWLGPDVDLTAVGGLAQVREWAAQGRGVALLPDFAVEADLAGRRLDRLDVPTPALRLRLVWRADRGEDPVVRRLLYAVSQA